MRRLLPEIGRYGLVGVAVTLLHLCVQSLLHRVVGLGFATAWLLAFVVAFAIAFPAHRSFTFRSERAPAQALPRFLATTLVAQALGYAVAVAAYRGLRESTGIADLAAWALGVAASQTVAFILARRVFAPAT